MGTFDRTGLQSRQPRADQDQSPSGPIRTCIGCRGRDSRSALLRVVAGSAADSEAPREGSPVPVIPDPGTRLDGRGAWLHPTSECGDLAVRRRAFARALRVQAPMEVRALTAYLLDLEQYTQLQPTYPKGTESGFDADEHPMSTQQ